MLNQVLHFTIGSPKVDECACDEENKDADHREGYCEVYELCCHVVAAV